MLGGREDSEEVRSGYIMIRTSWTSGTSRTGRVSRTSRTNRKLRRRETIVGREGGRIVRR